MKCITLLFASIFCLTAAQSQVIVTVAGTGTSGYSGDGGPATNAQMINPSAIVFDKDGNCYFSDDAQSRIRKITSGGIITTVAGNGTSGFSGDGFPATLAQIKGGGASQ